MNSSLDLGGVPKLPSETITRDIHCVTGWSKLDTVWEACRSTRFSTVSIPSAEYVMALSDGGYTTNLPLEDLTERQGLGRLRLRRRTPEPSMAGRPDSWCRTCISGRARSGCADSN